MELFDPPARDSRGRPVNPEDAEARSAAKARHRQRTAAEKTAAEPHKAKPQQEPSPVPQERKRRRRGHRNSATLEDALTAAAPAQPEKAATEFRHPDPLAGDTIMDATARLLAPRSRPAGEKRTNRDNNRGRQKKSTPPAPEPILAPKRASGAPVPTQKTNRSRRNQRGTPPDLRRSSQKDSTEQPSLMKPYYISHD